MPHNAIYTENEYTDDQIVEKMKIIVEMKKLYDDGVPIHIYETRWGRHSGQILIKGNNEFVIDFNGEYEQWDGVPLPDRKCVVDISEFREAINEYCLAVKRGDSNTHIYAIEAVNKCIELTYTGGKKFIDKHFLVKKDNLTPKVNEL